METSSVQDIKLDQLCAGKPRLGECNVFLNLAELLGMLQRSVYLTSCHFDMSANLSRPRGQWLEFVVASCDP